MLDAVFWKKTLTSLCGYILPGTWHYSIGIMDTAYILRMPVQIYQW